MKRSQSRSLSPARLSATTSTAYAIARRIESQQDHTGPALHALLREVSKQLAKHDGREVVHIALALNEGDAHPYRFVACSLIFHRPDALARLTLKVVEQLGRGVDSWGDVDVFAGLVAGPAWRVGRLKDSHIHRWARSENQWWRRAALVSTVALNRKSVGGTGDVARTIAVCRLLADDANDMVAKALSWALRELIPHDTRAVQAFVSSYKRVLARRVVREVTNKLTMGVKNPRRCRSATGCRTAASEGGDLA